MQVEIINSAINKFKTFITIKQTIERKNKGIILEILAKNLIYIRKLFIFSSKTHFNNIKMSYQFMIQTNIIF